MTDQFQTWLMYAYLGDNDLIRFWGHEVKGHRGNNAPENKPFLQ